MSAVVDARGQLQVLLLCALFLRQIVPVCLLGTPGLLASRAPITHRNTRTRGSQTSATTSGFACVLGIEPCPLTYRANARLSETSLKPKDCFVVVVVVAEHTNIKRFCFKIVKEQC